MFAKSISTVVFAHYFIWTKELTQNILIIGLV